VFGDAWLSFGARRSAHRNHNAAMFPLAQLLAKSATVFWLVHGTFNVHHVSSVRVRVKLVECRSDDVEKYKQNDLLKQVLEQMAGEFPTLSRVLVHERDLYMALYARMVLRNMTFRKYDQFQRTRQADGRQEGLVCLNVNISAGTSTFRILLQLYTDAHMFTRSQMGVRVGLRMISSNVNHTQQYVSK
jgi:hypothetical protein